MIGLRPPTDAAAAHMCLASATRSASCTAASDSLRFFLSGLGREPPQWPRARNQQNSRRARGTEGGGEGDNVATLTSAGESTSTPQNLVALAAVSVSARNFIASCSAVAPLFSVICAVTTTEAHARLTSHNALAGAYEHTRPVTLRTNSSTASAHAIAKTCVILVDAARLLGTCGGGGGGAPGGAGGGAGARVEAVMTGRMLTSRPHKRVAFCTVFVWRRMDTASASAMTPSPTSIVTTNKTPVVPHSMLTAHASASLGASVQPRCLTSSRIAGSIASQSSPGKGWSSVTEEGSETGMCGGEGGGGGGGEGGGSGEGGIAGGGGGGGGGRGARNSSTHLQAPEFVGSTGPDETIAHRCREQFCVSASLIRHDGRQRDRLSITEAGLAAVGLNDASRIVVGKRASTRPKVGEQCRRERETCEHKALGQHDGARFAAWDVRWQQRWRRRW
eukprot:scaffold19236_cov24-Tisochrysis_lutea.AAC.4